MNDFTWFVIGAVWMFLVWILVESIARGEK